MGNHALPTVVGHTIDRHYTNGDNLEGHNLDLTLTRMETTLIKASADFRIMLGLISRQR